MLRSKPSLSGDSCMRIRTPLVLKWLDMLHVRPAYRAAKMVWRHGPKYPVLKNVAPGRILNAKPIRTLSTGDLTVCVLTSKYDWLACLWSLVSFYEFSG